jgi:hypothetical protein
MKPRLKLDASGHIEVLERGSLDWQEHEAKREIAARYGGAINFAHRLGVSHHDVYRALHPVVGPKAAGKAARIRAVLGLPTAAFPRGQGLAIWHASGRKA